MILIWNQTPPPQSQEHWCVCPTRADRRYTLQKWLEPKECSHERDHISSLLMDLQNIYSLYWTLFKISLSYFILFSSQRTKPTTFHHLLKLLIINHTISIHIHLHYHLLAILYSPPLFKTKRCQNRS